MENCKCTGKCVEILSSCALLSLKIYSYGFICYVWYSVG